MSARPSPASRSVRRPQLAATAGVIVAVGLAVSSVRRAVGTDAGWAASAADLAGDALDAALVRVLLALVTSRADPRRTTGVAVALCTVVELAQLTGLPAAAAATWWPLRYVLGTTFAVGDLAAYALGAGAAGWALGHRGRAGGAHGAPPCSRPVPAVSRSGPDRTARATGGVGR